MRISKARGGTVRADLEAVEAAVLASCAADLLALLATDEDDEDEQADPLAALIGLPSGDVPEPEDPALVRLLPAAYGDDPEAAKEFRRYTDSDLRAGKRGNAGTLLATLPDGGGRVVLDREQADAWLGCLNDLRLVLGTRLDVTEEMDVGGLTDDDPRRRALEVYGWLGWVQESLIGCLSPRR